MKPLVSLARNDGADDDASKTVFSPTWIWFALGKARTSERAAESITWQKLYPLTKVRWKHLSNT